jgi:hypothetical protein
MPGRGGPVLHLATVVSAVPTHPPAPAARGLDPRRVETVLAYATLAALVLYVPVETWVSAQYEYGLLNPFYVIDLIAMLLLLYGAVRSLRARPHPAPGALCAAYAWTAANGWRSTWDRVFDLKAGGQLDYGFEELCLIACATILSLMCLASAYALMLRAEPRRAAASSN